ncbi:MAG: L-threonylcarbamoyladenylate synthase [Eubacteriales bacterium]|nr:L-threonylcarbamoyladenylate synthase [Eubacteriales bacterium]
METVIADMKQGIDRDAIKTAGSILKDGGLVAFPTETVYGLGADALDEQAAKRIYAAKGRPSDNPLIVHIAKIEDLYKIAESVPLKARTLAERFWPGPLTMIFRKKECVPDGTTGGLGTVAVRMPKDDIALALIEAGGGFVAAPSANTSGRPSPTKAEHVVQDMNGKIEMIIDGGEVGIGVESTIIDMSEDIPMVLRPGYINEKMLREAIGEVMVDPALFSVESGVRPKAPGMKYRHYAPKADMIIVEGADNKVISFINEKIGEALTEGRKIGVIASDETTECYSKGVIRSMGSRKDELSISKKLYSVLREFDSLGVDTIYSEAFNTPAMGQAIMNRLVKAAGHQIINV